MTSPSSRFGSNGYAAKVAAAALLFLSALLAPSFANASNISTHDWGVYWACPTSWPSAVQAPRTPGSDSFSSLRVGIPHLYPFLDGCDTRDVAAAFAGVVTNSPAHTNITARLSHWPEFLDRKDLLRQMKVGDNDVLWGSSAMDAVLASNGAPSQVDFSWMRDPSPFYYGEDAGTAWMPCFRTLYYGGSFDNDWYYEWRGGVAAILGWKHVSLEEPGESSFSHFFIYTDDYPATKDTTMDDVIEKTFRDASPDAILQDTFRNSYPMVATAHQTLSLFDRTYFAPDEFVSVTNETQGSGSVWWTYDGTADTPIVVRGGEIQPLDGSGLAGALWVSFTRTDTGEELVASNVVCSFKSPRVTVSQASCSATASGSTNAVGVVTLTAEDIYPYVPTGGDTNTWQTYEIHADPGLNTVTWWIVATNGEASATTNESPSASIPDGDYYLTFHGRVSSGYFFRKAFDIAVQDDGSSRWRYPTNVTYVAEGGVSHTFFRSFATVNVYKGHGEWLDINFDYGEGDDWQWYLDYGYAANKKFPTAPTNWKMNLAEALDMNALKCRSEVGNDFDTSPRSYVGMSNHSADLLIEEINESMGWEAEASHLCLGQLIPSSNSTYTATFRFLPGDTPHMEPQSINLSTVSIGVHGSYAGDPAQTPVSTETRIKGVIQVDWDFPQVRRSRLP